MIPVTGSIALDENDMSFQFVRASGPGGQNVNKVASAVQLRFDLGHCTSLPDAVRMRLAALASRRLSGDGVLVIDARRFRTQERNRQDAIDRLVELVRRATEAPRPRRPTKPTRASKERRLKEKQQRGATKRGRGRVDSGD